MKTRFSVLPDERRLLLGVDRAEIFKTGVIYEVTEIIGQIIFTPIGEYALPHVGVCPCEQSEVANILYSGLHLVTKREQELANNVEE